MQRKHVPVCDIHVLVCCAGKWFRWALVNLSVIAAVEQYARHQTNLRHEMSVQCWRGQKGDAVVLTVLCVCRRRRTGKSRGSPFSPSGSANTTASIALKCRPSSCRVAPPAPRQPASRQPAPTNTNRRRIAVWRTTGVVSNDEDWRTQCNSEPC